MFIKNIKKTASGYEITYIVNEYQSMSFSCSPEQLEYMEGLFKQARLSQSDVEVSSETIEDVLKNSINSVREELEEKTDKEVSLLQSKYEELEALIYEMQNNRDKLWHGIFNTLDSKLRFFATFYQSLKDAQFNIVKEVTEKSDKQSNTIDMFIKRVEDYNKSISVLMDFLQKEILLGQSNVVNNIITHEKEVSSKLNTIKKYLKKITGLKR